MAPAEATTSFSHVHMYVDSLKATEEYEKLGAKLNALAKAVGPPGAGHQYDVVAGRKAWLALEAEHGNPCTGATDPESFSPAGQDVVEQLLIGMGWRVVGTYESSILRSLALESPDAAGVKIVVSAHPQKRICDLAEADGAADEKFDHFSSSHLARFSCAHNGRMGMAVLGFGVKAGDCEEIHAKYLELHPKLVVPGGVRSFPCGTKILEVFAYYKGEKSVSDADLGTMIRFVEYPNAGAPVLPGVQPVKAEFCGVGTPAYNDHWVSNVISRAGFVETLEETLGFAPKVDFNAGVVAAGEAQIESTVTGNSPGLVFSDEDVALKDQSQVYLPTNNALSEVGHVNIFLKEVGQGVQHIAARVEDLVRTIQRANDYRLMTGAGFSFLMIPKTYYGYFSPKHFARDTGIHEALAEQVLEELKKAGIADERNCVRLDATAEEVKLVLPQGVPATAVEHVLRARYRNLYNLLKEHVSEETYLAMVRNNILVDIQGEDLLMQIFTAKVMSRAVDDEAPFFEFIQRVCSQKGSEVKIKPGCGGFGIRNFLTLFLSIEVSKAATAQSEALAKGDSKEAVLQSKMVDAFTAQLDESNPILTGISDAMTAEGLALERNDEAEVARWAAEKAKGNELLQQVSLKYKNIMKELREKAAKP